MASKNYTSAQTRLARLKAKAAGDPTGGTAVQANQAALSQLIQNQARPLAPVVPAVQAPPTQDALAGAYQNALASQVAQLNQRGQLATQKQNLAAYEQTRKAQAQAVQSRLEDAIVTEDASIPPAVRAQLAAVLGLDGQNKPAATQNQARAALAKGLSDKDLKDTGWNRDHVNQLLDTYYKPGRVVDPAVDPNSIADMDAHTLFRLPAPPAAQAPGQTYRTQTGLARDFNRGAGIIKDNFNVGAQQVAGTPLLQVNDWNSPTLGEISTGAVNDVAGVARGYVQGQVLKPLKSLKRPLHYLFGKS